MTADLPLTPEDVDEMVSILDRTPYDRIEIRSDRFSLSVARSGEGWVQSWEFAGAGGGASAAAGPGSSSDRSQSVAAAGAAGPLASAAAASGIAGAGAGAVAGGGGDSSALAEGQQFIRSALPGTFYRSPSPGAAPFVEVGSPVQPDTVVGIIETMKLMTPVHAGVHGVVVALLVDDAAVVDEQAALMRVQTAPA